jgi:hypothetical protein
MLVGFQMSLPELLSTMGYKSQIRRKGINIVKILTFDATFLNVLHL